jgi:DNA-binding transcriptional LysR family regulator
LLRDETIYSGQIDPSAFPFVGKASNASSLFWLPARTNPYVSRFGDLIAEGFDLAVRFGNPPPTSTLVTRKLAETRILTVAAPAYLERRGRPAHPTDLSTHDCIDFRDPVTGRPFEWEFRRGREVLPVETSGPLLVSDVDSMLGACVAGAGVAQVMALGASELVAGGVLVELFPDWPDERFPLYSLQPGRGRSAAKVRAFLDVCRAATLGSRSPSASGQEAADERRFGGCSPFAKARNLAGT